MNVNGWWISSALLWKYMYTAHYQQTFGVLEIVDIAKILLIQDMGLVYKYRGKLLNDIQLNGKHAEGREKIVPF